MTDWIDFLDNQIINMQKNLLIGSGSISHEEAVKKAEKEYDLYREREMKELQSDFDLLLSSLPDNRKKQDENN